MDGWMYDPRIKRKMYSPIMLPDSTSRVTPSWRLRYQIPEVFYYTAPLEQCQHISRCLSLSSFWTIWQTIVANMTRYRLLKIDEWCSVITCCNYSQIWLWVLFYGSYKQTKTKPPVKLSSLNPFLGAEVVWWIVFWSCSQQPRATSNPPSPHAVAVHTPALWIIDIFSPTFPSSPICLRPHENDFTQKPKDHHNIPI